MTDTVLIVDDEDGVRRTFQEWLAAVPNVRVFAVADAESALNLANKESIDLAVLDWNLGSGSDGLQLLEDLAEFQPDLVAILITGFAAQATPLDALRMGVRDYLDKNQNLTKEVFLKSVKKQLERIQPVKRQRLIDRGLRDFRDAVEKVLPIIQGTAALNDPLPLPAAVHRLVRFAIHSTGAASGVLILKHADVLAAYDSEGKPIPLPDVPFAQTIAAGVVSQQQPCLLNSYEGVTLFPFEQNRKAILAAPLAVGSGTLAVIELFDKPDFSEADRRTLASAAEVGAELLKQALAERRTNRLLTDALEAALRVGGSLDSQAPEAAAMDKLRTGLAAEGHPLAEVESGLKLLEAVRELSVRYGPAAIDHACREIESVRKLLLETVG